MFDVRNNVIYDYGEVASGMTGDRLSANYVANYVRPGPSSDPRRGAIVLTDTADVRYFVRGNVVDGRGDIPAVDLFDRLRKDGRTLVTLFGRPFRAPPVRTTSAVEALRDVLGRAGAAVPRRDAVDARIIREVERRSGSIIDSQTQVGGWPPYASGTAPRDGDGDGIPDEWERTHGLDVHNAADGAALARSGYTNLEVYLNALAEGSARR